LYKGLTFDLRKFSIDKLTGYATNELPSRLRISSFHKIAFARMSSHVPISFIDMFPGLTVLLTIASVMIGSQTLRIARMNPAEVLKNE
jgi:hypothetical protein